MKNIFLTSVSAAALFVAGPALAQSNTSIVNQSNQFNDAEVAQTGSNATATVTQSGNGNNADKANEVLVEQAGNGAEALVLSLIHI